jgi:molybdopterin biosynthesis enzyme
MADAMEARQRIARLAPLGEVWRKIDALVRPVPPQDIALADSLGLTLARDVSATVPRPAAATALRDGWALSSDMTVDASAYAPVPLPAMPRFVDIGEAIPSGTDTVAPPDAVTLRDVLAEAIGPVATGEGVLPAGGDVRSGESLRLAGDRLRAADLAAIKGAGIERVSVRMPRVLVARTADDALVNAAAMFMINAVREAGGAPLVDERADASLAPDFAHAAGDAVIAIGGTGVGRRDTGVRRLAQAGRVEVHGIAISPGETAAFGTVGARPVLLVPGRLDAAIAVWLLLGRRILMRLCGRDDGDESAALELTRKITSALGLTELVPVRREGNTVIPLASGYLPLSVLAHADGWILVAPESEGFPAGAMVQVRAWP